MMNIAPTTRRKEAVMMIIILVAIIDFILALTMWIFVSKSKGRVEMLGFWIMIAAYLLSGLFLIF